MKLIFKPLGEYIRAIDERNTEMVIENNLGINIDKQFIPSVANTVGTNLRNYKLLKKGFFACNLMHVGRDKRLPIARYTDESPSIVSPAYNIFEIKNEQEIDPKYLMLYFQCPDFDRMCWFKSDYNVRGAISWDVLCNIPIPVPNIFEQRKIVHDYQVITDRIALLGKINDNLFQQVNNIFKYWFTDNPSLDTLEQVPLAELCLVVTKGTTPTTIGKPFVSGGINFIKAESILDNHAIDKDKFAFIDSETNDLLRRSIISSGDIVFTIAGTLGRFALIDDSVLPANTNQAVAIIRANQSKVTPEYLYSVFLGNWHNDYYTKRIQQAVQANLSLGTIKSLPIPILSDKEMPEYLGIINPIIVMTKDNELEISKLRTMRDALLPQLMSGQLDLSDLEFKATKFSFKEKNQF